MKVKTWLYRGFDRLLYVWIFLIVCGWWGLTLRGSYERSLCSLPPQDVRSRELFSKAELKRALQGDWEKMRTLLSRWYLEGESALPESLWCEALALSHLVGEGDGGQRIFPHPWAAATILLALGDVDELVALPRGLKACDTLFGQGTYEAIPLETDGVDGEWLAHIGATKAIVAPYSNPAMVQALKRQNLPTYTIAEMDSIDQVLTTIEALGLESGHRSEGRLMRLFVEMAMEKLDHYVQGLPERRWLYVHSLGGNYRPQKESIVGELLQRMGMEETVVEKRSYPMTLEEITLFHPERLLVSGSVREELYTLSIPIYLLDQAVQESPTQFVALAYYDLIEQVMQ